MVTTIKHPVPDRVKPLFVILTPGHTDSQGERQSDRMPKLQMTA